MEKSISLALGRIQKYKNKKDIKFIRIKIGRYRLNAMSQEVMLNIGDLPTFYARVRRLGALDKQARTAELRRLAPQVARTE